MLDTDGETPGGVFKSIPNTAMLICGTVAFIGMMSVYVILTMNNKDTNALLIFVGGILALIPGTAAWKNTDRIKHATNGPLTATSNSVSQLEVRMSSVETAVGEIRDMMVANGYKSTEGPVSHE